MNRTESVRVTAGRIVRSGLWGLLGHSGYLLVSLLVTPFVIRRLGPENYGLLALLNITAGYLGFADLGMGVASTRFGGQALARGDQRGESAVVWTSVAILAAPLLGVALGLAWWAKEIARVVLDIRGPATEEAAAILRLASVVLVSTALAGVFNTSAIVRLRNGVVAAIALGSSVVQGSFTVATLARGGGLRGVGGAVAAAASFGALGQLVASTWMCPVIRRPEVRRNLVGPLLRFGGSVMLAAILAALLQNAEKFLVIRLVSVRDLAYYNVAFTLAGLAALFGTIVSQPFMPAFLQLLGRGESGSALKLYAVSRRGMVLAAGPVVLLAGIAGGPFLRLWAGKDFLEHGFVPFCVLLAGSAFSLSARLPQGLLLATGHADVAPRLHAAQLVPYLAATVILVRGFGPSGAAVGWTARAMFDYWFYSRTASRRAGAEPDAFGGKTAMFMSSLAVLVGPVALVWMLHPGIVIAGPVAAGSIAAYAWIAWTRLLPEEDRLWIRTQSRRLAGLGPRGREPV